METKQKRTKVKVSVLGLAVLVLLTLSGPAWAVEGMISYWKFDEGSETIATDSVGTNDGTLVNGPVWTSGQVDGALSFDGSDDYIYVSDSASLASPSSTQELTIEAWLYAKSLPKQIYGIVIKRPGSSPWQMEYQFLTFNGRLTFAATMGGWYREYLSTGADLGNELNR